MYSHKTNFDLINYLGYYYVLNVLNYVSEIKNNYVNFKILEFKAIKS